MKRTQSKNAIPKQEERPPTPSKDRLAELNRNEQLRVFGSIGLILIASMVMILYPAYDIVLTVPSPAEREGIWLWISPWIPPHEIILIIPGSRRLEWIIPWIGYVPNAGRAIIGGMIGMVLASIGVRWDSIIRDNEAVIQNNEPWTYLRIRIPQTITVSPDQTITFFRTVADILPQTGDHLPALILSYVGEAQQSVVQGVLIRNEEVKRARISSLSAIAEGSMIDETPEHPYLASMPKMPWRAVSVLRAVGQEGLPIPPGTNPMGMVWVGALIAAILRIPSGCAGAMVSVAPARTQIGALVRGSIKDTLRESGTKEPMIERMVPDSAPLMRAVIRIFARAATEEQAKAIVTMIEQAVCGKQVVVQNMRATWRVVATNTWSDEATDTSQTLPPRMVVWGWAAILVIIGIGLGWSMDSNWRWLWVAMLMGISGGTGAAAWLVWKKVYHETWRRWIVGIAMDPPAEPIRAPWLPRLWRRY